MLTWGQGRRTALARLHSSHRRDPAYTGRSAILPACHFAIELRTIEHEGNTARIVHVVLVGGDCCHTCVDEESFKDELHEEEGLHQVLPCKDENEPAAVEGQWRRGVPLSCYR